MLGGGVSFVGKPKALMCYICGREYGTKSLEIHIKTCIKKWETEENKKPKKDRRPLPQPPKGFNEIMSKGDVSWKEVEAWNNQANDKYNAESLIRCPNCNRTFLEDRLKIHNKVCSPEKPFKPLPPPDKRGPTGGGDTKDDYAPIKGKGYNIPEDNFDEGSQNLVECSKCGRKFAADRISKHQSICKGDSTAKKHEPKASTSSGFNPKSNSGMPNKSAVNNEGDAKRAKWKMQHEDFINNMKFMKAAKKIEEAGGDIRQLQAPKSQFQDDLTPCPYCGRKFNEQAAQRHIPKCKDIINKPKPPPGKSGSSTQGGFGGAGAGGYGGNAYGGGGGYGAGAGGGGGYGAGGGFGAGGAGAYGGGYDNKPKKPTVALGSPYLTPQVTGKGSQQAPQLSVKGSPAMNNKATAAPVKNQVESKKTFNMSSNNKGGYKFDY